MKLLLRTCFKLQMLQEEWVQEQKKQPGGHFKKAQQTRMMSNTVAMVRPLIRAEE